ncbi:hypothetical protein THRCLA_05832 [Thraustotheca clavata]|uniref:ENTH domain-containing protein n=1 Tax=Thraustotheca clavata TaxID=74557 RepID=A0A1V9ZSE7_9STRA|nr:hypothetical protein THRCLA_05832 [Thraustotheca clavata]
MEKIIAALDEAIDHVKATIPRDNRAPVYRLLDEHLTNTSPGLSPTILNDFASRSLNSVDCKRILERIWWILHDCIDERHRMRKALQLLHYCLIHGSKRVVQESNERQCLLRNIGENYNREEFEQYKYSKDLDAGAGVRKIAMSIYDLLLHPQELERERTDAVLLKQQLFTRVYTPRADTSEEYRRPEVYSDIDLSSLGWGQLGGVGHIKYAAHVDVDDLDNNQAVGDISMTDSVEIQKSFSPKSNIIASPKAYDFVPQRKKQSAVI